MESGLGSLSSKRLSDGLAAMDLRTAAMSKKGPVDAEEPDAASLRNLAAMGPGTSARIEILAPPSARMEEDSAAEHETSSKPMLPAVIRQRANPATVDDPRFISLITPPCMVSYRNQC